MELRKAEFKDMEMLCAFAERTFRTAYESLNEPEPFNAYCQEAFTPEQFRLEMDDPAATFWLAWLDGAKIGREI